MADCFAKQRVRVYAYARGPEGRPGALLGRSGLLVLGGGEKSASAAFLLPFDPGASYLFVLDRAPAERLVLTDGRDPGGGRGPAGGSGAEGGRPPGSQGGVPDEVDGSPRGDWSSSAADFAGWSRALVARRGGAGPAFARPDGGPLASALSGVPAPPLPGPAPALGHEVLATCSLSQARLLRSRLLCCGAWLEIPDCGGPPPGAALFSAAFDHRFSPCESLQIRIADRFSDEWEAAELCFGCVGRRGWPGAEPGGDAAPRAAEPPRVCRPAPEVGALLGSPASLPEADCPACFLPLVPARRKRGENAVINVSHALLWYVCAVLHACPAVRLSRPAKGRQGREHFYSVLGAPGSAAGGDRDIPALRFYSAISLASAELSLAFWQRLSEKGASPGLPLGPGPWSERPAPGSARIPPPRRARKASDPLLCDRIPLLAEGPGGEGRAADSPIRTSGAGPAGASGSTDPAEPLRPRPASRRNSAISRAGPREEAGRDAADSRSANSRRRRGALERSFLFSAEVFSQLLVPCSDRAILSSMQILVHCYLDCSVSCVYEHATSAARAAPEDGAALLAAPGGARPENFARAVEEYFRLLAGAVGGFLQVLSEAAPFHGVAYVGSAEIPSSQLLPQKEEFGREEPGELLRQIPSSALDSDDALFSALRAGKPRFGGAAAEFFSLLIDSVAGKVDKRFASRTHIALLACGTGASLAEDVARFLDSCHSLWLVILCVGGVSDELLFQLRPWERQNVRVVEVPGPGFADRALEALGSLAAFGRCALGGSLPDAEQCPCYCGLHVPRRGRRR